MIRLIVKWFFPEILRQLHQDQREGNLTALWYRLGETRDQGQVLEHYHIPRIYRKLQDLEERIAALETNKRREA
jgi:hypothetical protein